MTSEPVLSSAKAKTKNKTTLKNGHFSFDIIAIFEIVYDAIAVLNVDQLIC